MIRMFAAVAALLGAAAPSFSQTLLYSIDGLDAQDFFGASLDGGRDLDGDGLPDLLVGAFGYNTIGGRAEARSGPSGQPLQSFVTGGFVTAASLDDLDQDGVADLAIGDSGAGQGSGRVVVFSAVGGKLFEVAGAAPKDSLGASVAQAGDVNLDGFPDLIAGAPQLEFPAPGPGLATVFSGFDGSVLRQFAGGGPGDGFGAAVAGVGDVDLDGVSDVAVGAPFDDDNGADSGQVRVFSGAGPMLFASDGVVAGARFGGALAGLTDVNADGRPDLAASSVGLPGSTSVLSGANGQVVFTHSGPSAAVAFAGDTDGDAVGDLIVGSGSGAMVLSGKNGLELFAVSGGDNLGAAVAGVGDVNGDGRADVAIADPVLGSAFGEQGRVFVYSLPSSGAFGAGCAGSGGFVPSLALGSPPIAGANVTLSVQGGLGGSNALFFAGTAPAFVPLGSGCAFLLSPVLPPFLSVPLGGAGPGSGTANIVGPLAPQLAGVTFYLQAFVIDPGAPLGAAASNGLEIAVQ